MYPTKSMLDYMTEMNRLFPRNSENDMLQSSLTPNTSHSLNQSSMARSSSSTDTSPDSFPDMSNLRYPDLFQQYEVREHFNHRTDLVRQREAQRSDQFARQGDLNQRLDFERHQYDTQRLDHGCDYKPEMADVPYVPQIYETPFVVKRQRPIVGRKIVPTANPVQNFNEVSNVWSDDTLLMPNMEQKNNQNVFYELFPSENKGLEFKTSPNSMTSPQMYPLSPRMSASPNITNMSPRMTNMSPSMTNMSPRMTNISPSMINMSQRMTSTSQRVPEMSPSRKTSPGTSTSSFSPRFSTPFKEPIVGPSTSFWQNSGSAKMCTFCRKNGETSMVYMTHTVKEKIGNKNVVTCPILRSHVCSTCGATGDNAHTITYCPILRSTNNGQPLKSTTITLKNTRVKSNGRRRY